MRAVVVMLLPLLAGVAGCQELMALNSQSPQANFPASDPKEYEPYLHPGTGSISGQAFLVTSSGDAKRAAGKTVTLDPLTSLSRYWWNEAKAYQRLDPAQPADSRFQAARKSVMADADGHFSFDHLPPGDYLVRTTVRWQPLYCSSNYGCGEQAGVVGGPVHLGAGENKTNVNFGQDAKPLPADALKKK